MIGKMLVIEDDRELAQVVGVNMRDLGFEVDQAHDGLDGLQHALEGDVDFIILDLQLPGLNGIDVCQRIRQQGRETPILILTSRREEVDKVVGLESGADDYLTKPFSIRELQARVRAISRRSEKRSTPQQGGEQAVLKFGRLRIDSGRCLVTLDGEPVELTAKEYKLLVYFASHPGHVFTRTQLLENVWGYGYDGYEHTVNSTINRLRNKIELDPAKPLLVVTVRGMGYKFAG